MSEKQAKTAIISIGTNLGDKKRNIELTKFELKKNDIKIIKSSSKYETLSWPNKAKPKFINVVLIIKTHLSAYDLLKKCLSIEKKFESFLNWILDLREKLKIPHKLSDVVEVNNINIDKLSKMAIEDQSTSTNPRKMTIDDIKILYEYSISGKLF